MASTNRLAHLYIWRDALEESLGNGNRYVEVTIRGKQFRKETSLDLLAYYNEQIRIEEAKAQRNSGPARNRARLYRA